MEILFLLLLFGFLGKGTTKAVVGGGKKRHGKTNWSRLSYGQKAWLHDQTNGL